MLHHQVTSMYSYGYLYVGGMSILLSYSAILQTVSAAIYCRLCDCEDCDCHCGKTDSFLDHLSIKVPENNFYVVSWACVIGSF